MVDSPSERSPSADESGEVTGKVRWLIGFMSAANRRGRFRVGKRVTAVGVMGAAILDLTRARFETPQVRVTVVSFWGGVELIVAEGTEVELTDLPILGATSVVLDEGSRRPGTPVVSVRALNIMGGTQIKNRGSKPGKPTKTKGDGSSKARGPFSRSASDRVVAGVAGGISANFRIDVNVVRLVFAVATLAGGWGLAVYMLGWLFLPREESSKGAIAQSVLHDRRLVSRAAGVGALILIVALLAARVGIGLAGVVAFPLAVSAAAAVLIWSSGGDEERNALARLTQLGDRRELAVDPRGWRLRILRLAAGMAFVATGLAAFFLINREVVVLRNGLLAMFSVLCGVALLFGPWWLSLAGDLAAERRERIRSQERADMAARVHDSVLQTLALIQGKADDPRAVVSLARGQERELRDWLYHGPIDTTDVSLRTAIERVAREVETDHGMTVDTVIVGDAEIDDPLAATVAAAKEPLVNAAKWSGVLSVSLYAELEPTGLTVFVRDRGVGFDPSRVAGDHHGIAESICARMQRHGGTAIIRSQADTGTEVQLSMPVVV